MNYSHTPVMLKEVIKYLDPYPGQYFIDCTLGGGGYTFALAEKIGPTGKVVAIDLDQLAIANAKNIISSQPDLKDNCYTLKTRGVIKNNKFYNDHQIKENKKTFACALFATPDLLAQSGGRVVGLAEGNNIILVHENFKNLSKIVKDLYTKKKIQSLEFNGIVFDLGLSSAQLQDRTRGFSFQQTGPLDMAFGQVKNNKRSTSDIVNNWPVKELEHILREYGEERFARLIAQAIISKRKIKPIKTTEELVKIIEEAVPKKFQYQKIHPATRSFQALRIATNDELNNLEVALAEANNLLKVSGKLIVISYHSLEDRIVKNFFKKESKDCLCPPTAIICQCGHQANLKIITKKVIKASDEEIKNNPRARSAKMRVAVKL
ncbi:MAG: 16S rRNA (cytosine(1402)-N(4))-methyltransferase RsmH [Patescibacteria group bacterium]